MGKLEHALLYAAAGWPVFQVTAFKTPFKNSHGHKDAVTDAASVRALWKQRPNANIALATGSIVCIDLDGTAWAQSPWGVSLAAAAQANGGMPATLMQRTSGGVHLLFKADPAIAVRSRNEPRRKGSPGVDIKGAGGFIVLAPSVNGKTGFVYRFVNPGTPPAALPVWLAVWCQTVGQEHRIVQTDDLGLGPVPSYLKVKNEQYQRRVAERSSISEKPVFNADEHNRIRAALAAVHADKCGHDEFVRIGLGLVWLDWIRSDGSNVGLDLFDEWCSRSAERYNPEALGAKWQEFERSSRGEVTIGSIYHLARQHGWNGQAAFGEEVVQHSTPGLSTSNRAQHDKTMASAEGETALATELRSPLVREATIEQVDIYVNGHVPKQLPPELALAPASIRFLDVSEDGFPKNTMMNAHLAVGGLRVRCRHDTFHGKTWVEGSFIKDFKQEANDDILLQLRAKCRMTYQFDPGSQHMFDAVQKLGLDNEFDPLLEFLDTLKWDGQPRLDSWLVDHLGAIDTPFVRAVSALSLIAAVRRAKHPGTKFDQCIVLEGEEGINKSSAIEIMAGRSFFSEQHVLGLSGREQQEAINGVWLYEIADLTGMRRSEVEHVKAFLSRTEDRARGAYQRYRTDNPRRCIFFATTNEDSYLKSDTGNRRFWPIKVVGCDTRKLKAARDQILAEAVFREAKGESIVLSEKLWGEARAEQESRLEKEAWSDAFHRYLNGKEPVNDTTIHDLLVQPGSLGMPAHMIRNEHSWRAGRALRQLGWVRYRKREGAALVYRWRRFGVTPSA
jgi:hypothetical protein